MPERPEPKEPTPIKPEEGRNPPTTDTSTDWDEWMERHGDKPRPVSDVADAEGKVTPTPRS
jgi:hypothetical protein